MKASTKWAVLAAMTGAFAVGCSAEAEGEDVGVSEDGLGTVVTTPVSPQCLAKTVLELPVDMTLGGPTLFVACEGHTADPYRAQSIRVTTRDPNNGTLYSNRLWDGRDPDGVVCTGGNCQSFGAPLVIEHLCNKDLFYKCPCGIVEVSVADSPYGQGKSYRCKTSPLEGVAPRL